MVTIQAHNAYGYSAVSSPHTSSVTVQTEPSQVLNLQPGSATDESLIQVSWSALTGSQTGGSSILEYIVEWGSGFSLSASTQSTSLTTSTGITAGTTYTVRVRARNKWGYGPYSSTVQLKAAVAPSQMSALSTSVSGKGVTVSFSAPADGSSTITAYEILIKQSGSDTYSAVTSE